MFSIKKLSYRVFNVFMVVALLLGFAVIPAGAGPGGLEEDVEVLILAPPSVYVCEEFYVNVVVANASGVNFQDTTVNIDWLGYTQYVEMLDPVVVAPAPTGTYTQTITSLGDGELADLWYTFHCTATETITFTVTVSNTIWDDSKVVTAAVLQKPVLDPVLEIRIIQQPDYPVEPCENFAIKATITNISSEPVYTTTVTIANTKGQATHESPMSVMVGTIRPEESQEVGFTWHCDGPLDAEFLLDATFHFWDGTACPAGEIDTDPAPSGHVTPAEVTVVQAGTTLSIALTTDHRKLCASCDEWGLDTAIVTASVKNTGDEIATDVEVQLEKTSGGATVSPLLWQDMDDLAVLETAVFTWTVTCTSPGPAVFEGTAKAGNATIPAVVADTLTITQKSGLFVEIVEPWTAPTYSTKQEFPFKVRVTNCDEGNVGSVFVKITTTNSITLIVPGLVVIEEKGDAPYTVAATDEVELGTVCPCCWVDVTWMLRCDEANIPYTFEVVAWVDDPHVLDTDDVDITQEAKTHLMGGVEVFSGWESEGKLNVWPIEAVAVNEKFTIVVPVVNLGTAVAQDVVLTTTVTGPASCVGTWVYDGFGEVENGKLEKYFLEGVCTGPGPVSIHLELSGTDYNTQEAILEDNIELPECDQTLLQYDVTLEYKEPDPGQKFTVSDDYAVKVEIINSAGRDFQDVTVCLDWDKTQAELYGGSVECYDFTHDGQEESWLLDGAVHEFTWQMHCIHKGEMTFLVTLKSDDPRMKIEKWVTIVQEPAEFDWVEEDLAFCQLWNLMSLPLIPENPAIEVVLSRTAAEIKKVAHYTGGPAGDWQYYSGAPSDLTQMVDGKGYWMDVGYTSDPAADILRVWGYEDALPPPSVPPYYDVVVGWNMIGFKSLVPVDANDYLAAVAADVQVIYEFICADQLYAQVVLLDDELTPGSGYLIAMTAPGTIYPGAVPTP